jgi:hypothetical protein
MRNISVIFVVKPKGIRISDRPRHGWKHHIKTDFKEAEFEILEQERSCQPC